MANKDEHNILDNSAVKMVQAEAVISEKSLLGVSSEYKRDIFDDKSARKVFKEETFGNKKTIVDSVTGEVIHKSHAAAKRKYHQDSGSKAWTDHASETDHVISLERGHKMLSRNPFLSDKDVKTILNDKKYNYRETAKKYNASKQGKSDLQTSSGKSIQGIKNEVKAQVGIAANTTLITGKNIGREFVNGAQSSLEATAIPLLIAGTQNLILAAKGEKEFSDAVWETGEAIAGSAISGGTLRITTTALTNTMKNSSAEILQQLGNSNYIAQIITVSVIVKDSFIDYVNGEISGTEFMEQITEKGVALISGSIGAVAGQLLIPIPYVGAIIGSMIVSTVCVEIYKLCNSIKHIYQGLDDYLITLAKIDSIANAALVEMDAHRKYLIELIDEEYDKWDKIFISAFEKIMDSTLNDDVDGIAKGLDSILAVFDGKIKFNSLDEFNEFFDDKDTVFVL